MEPNKPTPPRRFGTDASLDWPEQLEQVKRANSKAVTRLSAMLDMAADGSEVAELVRALSQAQGIALKATRPEAESATVTDEQLVRKVQR